MTRPTTLARQIDLMVRTAVKHGLQPHIWIDEAGRPHVAPLTESPPVTPMAKDPWGDLVSGELNDKIRKTVRR
jgi:hypothetical protein